MGDREIDQQLVERAQRGDKRAFELLVLKYQRKLGRLLSRFVRDSAEVEDVTQEAFIKAYRALPQFREGTPEVRNTNTRFSCMGRREDRDAAMRG